MQIFEVEEQVAAQLALPKLSFVYPLAMTSLLNELGITAVHIPKIPFSSDYTQQVNYVKGDKNYSGIHGVFLLSKNKYKLEKIALNVQDKATLTLVFQKGTTESWVRDTANTFTDRLNIMHTESNIFLGENIEVSRNGIQFFSGIQDKPIFSKEVENTLKYSIYNPIKYHKEFPHFKRGILLSGTYGMGKSSVASYTASLAKDLGITFMYVKSADDFYSAKEYFKQIEGKLIVFVEDIDKLFEGFRDAAVDAILNALDSVDNKNERIMYIFTTNDISVLDRAMLRPGRIDSIVNLELPNRDAMFHILVRYTNGDTLASQELIESLSPGERYSPAVLREIAMRSFYAIRDTDRNQITGQDLKEALDSIRPQVKLIQEIKATSSKEQLLYNSLKKVIDDSLGNS